MMKGVMGKLLQALLNAPQLMSCNHKRSRVHATINI